jgi:hypothetical protein
MTASSKVAIWFHKCTVSSIVRDGVVWEVVNEGEVDSIIRSGKH